MRISALRLRHVRGTLPTNGAFWEERLARPIDVYPEYRARQDFEGGSQIDAQHFRVETWFLQIETDAGVHGIAGPIPQSVAAIIAGKLRPILLGRDPIAGEILWDQMHRLMVQGRQGETMLAISAVDCALWDLRGRWLGQPVHRLIGGAAQAQIPAYASMLGFDVLDPVRVRARAIEYKNLGFTAQKWFFRHGAMSGAAGLHKNVELVRTLRTALGEDYDIMLDCWQSMDTPYVIALAERIAEFRPRWLEECVMPDRIESYRRIKDKINIPLAGAEHEYTRWGFKRFIDAGALDILQPDIYWCGGFSETLKIAAYATAHDLIVIPHGHSTNAGIHFSVAQSPIHTPWQEYLVKWNDIHQHFLATPVRPDNGMLSPLAVPGFAMELDAGKIEEEIEVYK